MISVRCVNVAISKTSITFKSVFFIRCRRSDTSIFVNKWILTAATIVRSFSQRSQAAIRQLRAWPPIHVQPRFQWWFRNDVTFLRVVYGLLIAKLSAYGLDFNSCKLFGSYLYNRHQRVKFGDLRCEWSTVTKGVPQGSILSPLLFHAFIHDIFVLDCDCHIYNYADDDCSWYSSDTIDDIRRFLTRDIIVFMNWFKQNSLKANPEKFQSMLISSHDCDVGALIVNVENRTISSTETINVLGVNIDNIFQMCA